MAEATVGVVGGADSDRHKAGASGDNLVLGGGGWGEGGGGGAGKSESDDEGADDELHDWFPLRIWLFTSKRFCFTDQLK